ncbi:hypothetical protein C5E45_33270 [Nocardia nova]|uniref:Transporter n=1 Tax=Nocardia nova TaxID=37330 RepID=A0A2S6ACH0_9NOCA|nr:hypothetical protein [Nocardia nova]PPJ19623.1 hypothetical protein C5E41_30995 [Nocardia nova]PPJ31482.1 hypothetical protein C5E45_33270 [Nocardia nova]
MRTRHAVLEMITAALATLVAGLSLLLPNGFRWTSQTSVLQLDMLAASQPRAIAVGAIVALVVAVFATTVNHALVAWGTALCGVTTMFLAHLLAESGDRSIAPATLNYLEALAGGILLGGIAVAVLRGWLQVFGWTLGALAAVVFGQLGSTSKGTVRDGVMSAPGWSTTTLPPLWLIMITLVLVIVGMVVNRNQDTVERRSVELPMAPIVAGLVFVIVEVFGAEWLARHAESTGHIVTAAVLTVAAAVVAAVLLPRRDGVLILLAVALAAVGGALIPARLPIWSVAPLVLLIALGLIAGFRRPMPMLAVVALAAMALYCVLVTGHRIGGGVQAAVLSGLLAVLAGYSFGSAAPRYNPTRVLGVAIVFVPSVITALHDRLGRQQCVSDLGGWYLCPTPSMASPAPFWTALGITAGCAAGLLALRYWRKPTTTESVADI